LVGRGVLALGAGRRLELRREVLVCPRRSHRHLVLLVGRGREVRALLVGRRRLEGRRLPRTTPTPSRALARLVARPPAPEAGRPAPRRALARLVPRLAALEAGALPAAGAAATAAAATAPRRALARLVPRLAALEAGALTARRGAAARVGRAVAGAGKGVMTGWGEGVDR